MPTNLEYINFIWLAGAQADLLRNHAQGCHDWGVHSDDADFIKTLSILEIEEIARNSKCCIVGLRFSEKNLRSLLNEHVSIAGAAVALSMPKNPVKPSFGGDFGQA